MTSTDLQVIKAFFESNHNNCWSHQYIYRKDILDCDIGYGDVFQIIAYSYVNHIGQSSLGDF